MAKTGLRLHIAVNGRDNGSGALAEPDARGNDGPFATLDRARDAVREWRRTGGGGPAEVVIGAGTYRLTESFVLGPEDSGTANAPVVWRAAEGLEVRLIGGVEVTASELKPVTDPATLNALRPEARERLRRIDLSALGVTLRSGFAALGFGFPDIAADPEIFADGEPLRLSRWPKEGYLAVREVLKEGAKVGDPERQAGGVESGVGDDGGVFTCDEPRMAAWNAGRGICAFGYWMWDWAPSRNPVAEIGSDRVKLAGRTNYGIRPGRQGQGGRFCFLNVLEELSEPGEYCIDYRAGTLYLIPSSAGRSDREAAVPPSASHDPSSGGPAASSGSAICYLISALTQPLLVLRDAGHIRLRGLTLEGGRGDAVAIEGGVDNVLEACEIRNCGGKAAAVNGVHHGLRGCHLHDLGQGGVTLRGGDRRELVAACNVVEDCDIHDYNRVDPCYRPGVNLYGVGHRVRHNHIHHAPHFAVWAHGNDHLVEFNEIDRVCLDSSDSGAFYIGRNMSERGVMVRHNYFHHIGSGLHQGESAIYFDDGALGSAVGNVFYKAGTLGNARMGAIFIHMGKDVLIENNLFLDCELAIGTMPCGRKQWTDHINGIPSDYVHTWLYKDTDVTAPPYSTAYPDLKDLHEYPDRNVIRRNVAFKCNEFLSINRCRRREGFESFQQEMSANLLTDVDPGLVNFEKGDFRLKPDSRVFRIVAGFEPIPVELIGPRA